MRNLESRLKALEARARLNRDRDRWKWVNFLTQPERDRLREIVKRLTDLAPENRSSALTSEEGAWIEEAMNRKAKPRRTTLHADSSPAPDGAGCG